MMLFNRITICFCLFVCPLTALADADQIEPFGKFRWDNGIEDVLNVFKEMGVSASLGFGDPTPLNTDISVPEQIQKILNNSIQHNRKSYQDSLGNQQFYYTQPLRIVGEEVRIHEIPFKLEVDLKPFPGFSIAHHNKVLVTPDQKVHFPHILESITLTSKSPLIREHGHKIINALAKKYRLKDFHEYRMDIYENGGQQGSISFLIQNIGYVGAHLVVSAESAESFLSIDYGQYIENQMNDIYASHIAEIQSREKGNDFGGDL